MASTFQMALTTLNPAAPPQQMTLPAGIFLTSAERSDLTRWRARAAAELLSIEDGILGRGWRVRKRAAYLTGFIEGATSRLARDITLRN